MGTVWAILAILVAGLAAISIKGWGYQAPKLDNGTYCSFCQDKTESLLVWLVKRGAQVIPYDAAQFCGICRLTY